MGIDSIGEYIQRMSIRQLSVLMILVTLFVPNFVSYTSYTSNGILVYLEPVFLAMTWTYSAPYVLTHGGFQFLDPVQTFMYSIFTVPPILFAILVIRYCQGKNTSNHVWIGAALSVALNVGVGIVSIIGYFQRYEMFLYNGLIPIQLILGYLIVKYKESPLDSLHWDEEKESPKRVSWIK